MKKTIIIGMGCFWGVQKAADSLSGVEETTVGYMGGKYPNPTYVQVCTGITQHAEVVKITYRDEAEVLERILRFFWEQHDPTQGNRQGNDIGEQYRSVIFCEDETQLKLAESSAIVAQENLYKAGYGEITTQISLISDVGEFWPAEEYHQKYLEKNPQGYCPVHATGISCGWTAPEEY